MKYYAFKSSFGYNSMVREGKIMKFTSNDTLKYVLETNIDLVEIMSIFRIHLVSRMYWQSKYKKLKKKYKIPTDLYKRELGMLQFDLDW